MIRVCFLAGTLGRGGAERQLVYMLRALRDAPVATRVLSLTRGEVYEREIRAMGIPVAWVGRSRSKPARAAAIMQELRRERADIVQCAQTFVNLYAVAGARASGAVEIGALRTDPTRGLGNEHGWFARASLRLPRFLLANSELGARAAGRRRVFVVPNVVDTDRFHPLASAAERRPLRVLFLGRLSPEKRPDVFVRALAEVERRLPGCAEGWIAGEGPLRASIEALSSSLGLAPPRLRILGDQADAAALLREVDALVLPSDYEGQPNAVLEAMASGLPVIATRIAGVAEVVAPGSGILVDVGDHVAIAEGLRRLATDREFRLELGFLGRAEVMRRRSLARLGAHLLAIYSEVLEGRT